MNGKEEWHKKRLLRLQENKNGKIIFSHNIVYFILIENNSINRNKIRLLDYEYKILHLFFP